MNIIKRIYCRGYQFVFKIAMYFLDFKEPIIISSENGLSSIIEYLKKEKLSKIMIVTDKNILDLGLLDSLLKVLDENKYIYNLYSNVDPNPTIDNIKNGVKVYKQFSLQTIIACGGGSVIDCAKAIGALVNNPSKSIEQMRGALKVKKRPPILFAIPTTSGTGSEATIASVITNKDSLEKYAINDPKLIPDYALLEPSLTVKLPPKLTATTGMDALTHAVEAYIGRSNTKKTKKMALEAVKLISDNLFECYLHPNNLQARKNMQLASYKAGVAFTRAYVGYVHAIAHTFGGFYNVGHGEANAIILPYVLEAYDDKIYNKVSDLYEVVFGKDDKTSKEKTNEFIAWIKQMNKSMGIENTLGEVFKESDLDLMVKRADIEANPLYPVPKLMDQKELKVLYKNIVNKENENG